MTELAAMPRYEAYIDSGIDELEKIPSHWREARFRDIFKFSKGLTITKENLQDEGIPCVNYGEIHSKYGFEVDPEKHLLKCVDEKYLKHSTGSLLKYGDFVFADTSEDIEGSGNFTYLNSEQEVFAGYHTVITRPINDLNERFLAYMLESISFRFQIRKKVKGVKVYSVTQSILKSTKLWLPLQAEQRAIAHFLDQKVGGVDETISIKEQQIALLNERRQIMIQKAIIQGLDPEASTHNSGVDWIGEIPKHWFVLANRALFSERVQPGREGLPLLSVSIHSGVSSEEVSEEDNVRGRLKIADKSKYILVNKGDVAYNMMRAWQGGIGAVKTDGMVSPAYVVAKPKGLILAEYFEYQYRCPEFIQQMDRYSKGITDFRKRLYWDSFKQLKTIVPPENEQVEIVSYIQGINKSTQSATDMLGEQIARLKEYKATIINSAVTGKIKVPELSEYAVCP